MPDLIIDDSTSNDILFPSGCGTGAIPRDPLVQPLPMMAVDIPTIPRSEWSARIKEMKDTKSRVSDIARRSNWKRAIQWGYGYCWAHSSVNAATLNRVSRGMPHKQLSAFFVASIIKNGRDEGGWSPQSFEFMQKNGCCEKQFWPENTSDLSYNTQAARDNAALYKIVEGWVDLGRAVYDRTLTFDQIFSLALSRITGTLDLAWWGHSIAFCDPEEVEPGSFGLRIANSWPDGWGDDMGMGVLREEKCQPMSAVAVRSITVSGVA